MTAREENWLMFISAVLSSLLSTQCLSYMCVFVLGRTLLMGSCPRVAPAAGMEKRTGKMDPQPPLLHPTQSTLVRQSSTFLL